MRTIKRLICLVLALAMVSGMLCVPVTAADAQAESSKDDVTVQGTNGFGDLLADDMNDYQAQTDTDNAYSEGYSIIDLTVAGNIATVTYSALEDATVVVGIYTEDGLKLVASGQSTVSSEEEIVEVTIEGEIPVYFVASAYLLDNDDFSPLCAEYDTPMYTQEMQELLRSTVDDYPADRVLNLDDDRTTNFAVYADSTKVVQEVVGINTIVSIDEENAVYIIDDADESFTTLAVGDIVAYSYGEDDILIVKVAFISVSGDTVTITGGDLDMEEVFSHVKIEAWGDTNNVIVDSSTADEGITYLGKSEDAAAYARGNSNEGSYSGKLKFSYEGAKLGSDNAYVEFTANFELSAKATVSYYITQSYQNIKIEIKLGLEGSCEVTGALENEMPLGELLFPILPMLTVGIEPKLVAEFEGSLAASFGCDVKFGFIIDHGNQGWNKSGYKSVGKPELESEFSGKLFIGISMGAKIEVAKGFVAELKVTAKFGVTATLKQKIEPESSETVRHDCTICSEGDISFTISLSASAKFLKMKKLSFSATLMNLSYKICDLYWCTDHDAFGFSKCPHIQYKMTAVLVDKEGEPIPDVAVFAGVESAVTDKDGAVFFWLPVAEYEITATVGKEWARYTIYANRAQKITLKLGTEYDGRFDSADGNLLNANLIGIGNCGADGDNITWTLYENGLLIIDGFGEMVSYTWDNPAPWGEVLTSSLYVEISEGVTSIGERAFYNNYVAKIKIPSSLNTIGAEAFYCGADNVYITDLSAWCRIDFQGPYGYGWETCFSNPLRHAQNMYLDGQRITDLIFPDDVTTVSTAAFYCYQGLRSVAIPDTVCELGGSVFFGCDGITSVEFGQGLTSINYMAFMGCDNIAEIKIPDNITEISSFAFQGCDTPVIALCDNITYIGNYAFGLNFQLERIVIPASVTEIGKYCFEAMRNMREIVFMGNAPKMGTGCFDETTTTAYYPLGNETWNEDVKHDYGGVVTWVPYVLDENGNIIPVEAETNALRATPRSIIGGEHSEEETDTCTLQTASFKDLVPGAQYVLLVLADIEAAEPLAAENLLYIDQAVAGEDGTLEFRYILPDGVLGSYVMLCGLSSKNIQNAVITFPEMKADGSEQVVAPVVVFDGATLIEGRDYVITGNVTFIAAGEYSCTIEGIGNYIGTVEFAYTVLPGNQDACEHDLLYASSSTGHWQMCKNCDYATDVEAHSGQICQICGYENVASDATKPSTEPTEPTEPAKTEPEQTVPTTTGEKQDKGGNDAVVFAVIATGGVAAIGGGAVLIVRKKKK